jgi:hypothetical protein
MIEHKYIELGDLKGLHEEKRYKNAETPPVCLDAGRAGV